jgi:SacI homology domain
MGGTRYNARGIDEQGNVANCVETEQLVFKHVSKENQNRIYTYSFS